MDSKQMRTNTSVDSSLISKPFGDERNFNGVSCYYHKNEPSIAQCDLCEKNLCHDCANSYGFTNGDYAGKIICYDCTKTIWEEDKTTLLENYHQIKLKRLVCLIGTVIGALIALIVGVKEVGIGGLIFIIPAAAVGGSFGTYVRGLISKIPGFFVSTSNILISFLIGIAKFAFWFYAYIFVAMYETIKKLICYHKYIKNTEGYLEENEKAMQSLNDYMEYTFVRNKNKNIDIKTLIKENIKFADNSFVKMVQEQGEDEANLIFQNQCRHLNEFGEIVQSFGV